MRLSLDLHEVVGEVLSQVPRLLALQDKDPDSPMRGCMHPAYWRDKSSDVADMRRQEAALALAWAWLHPFPGNPWQGNHDVLMGSLRAIGFWTRQQHRDGTFDEWYKNEHGYATTAFSSYAMSLATEALGDALNGELRERTFNCIRKCGDWLATHDDWFKTNHQAVGVAALGAIGRVTGDRKYLDAAHRNAQRIVDRMHPEGWSKEISGLDVGYTFLLAEYMGMHAVLTGDTTFIPAITKAYRFAARFLHPDMTSGAEYGICGNPYFSRVATAVLKPHDGIARGVADHWMNEPLDLPYRDTSATLKDDLRLARYAYQPLLAALIYSNTLERKDLEGAEPREDEESLFIRDDQEHWFPEAQLLSVTREGYCAWAAPCHGGLVRVAFRDGDGFRTPHVDRGYVIDEGGHRYRNARYGLDLGGTWDGEVFRVTAPLVKTGFVMPPYWARVGLRVATSLPKGHRWTRWAIDKWRARKGTALNQSSAGVSRGVSPWVLQREVRFRDDRIEISDTIKANRPIPDGGLHMVVDDMFLADGRVMPDPDRRLPCPGTTIEKVIRAGGRIEFPD